MNYNIMYSAVTFVSLRKMVEITGLALQFVDRPKKSYFTLGIFQVAEGNISLKHAI